jgi:hypothetical protein
MNETVTVKPNSGNLSPLPTLISQYFETFNAEDFELTASLFAEDGVLHPPFDGAVVGREAIASYFNLEARGMKLNPFHCSSITFKDSRTEYTVVGQVHTPLFRVNICWLFKVNYRLEIVCVKVKLLASLIELLDLKKL